MQLTPAISFCMTVGEDKLCVFEGVGELRIGQYLVINRCK